MIGIKNQLQLLDELNNWKGDYPLESVAATIYHRWIYQLLKNTYKDELGSRLFTQFLDTHMHKRVIAPMAANSTSVWWDDIATETVTETQAEIVQKSYIEAFEALETEFGQDTSSWTWDKVHTLEHGHAIGQVGGVLRKFFNVGPYPIMGTKEVINNMAFSYNGSNYFHVGSGPSTRRVVEMMMNKEEILEKTKSHLKLVPDSE